MIYVKKNNKIDELKKVNELLSGHYFVFDHQTIVYFSGYAFSTQTSNVGNVNFMGSINSPCSLVHTKPVTVLFAVHIFATHQATR